MASVNKDILHELYIVEKLSIPDIANKLNMNKSLTRSLLIKNGITLRSRAEGVRCSSHKLGLHLKGKKRVFSDEWKENISKAKISRSDDTAKGFSLKLSGYIEITRGINKGKSQHVLIMQERIGRKLMNDEVVHHIDGDRSNNDINNLALMTKSGHCKHHALTNYSKRERGSNGQFK